MASKCYFHLEDYHHSLRLALCAGAHFDASARTEYVETLVARCIDEYTASRVGAVERGEEPSDAGMGSMAGVVNSMLERCWAEGSFRMALGVSLDARRLDAVERTLRLAVAAEAAAGHAGPSAFLAHAYDLATVYTAARPWRQQVLQLLVRIHADARDTLGCTGAGAGAGEAPAPSALSRDWVAQCRTLQCLRDAPALAAAVVALAHRACGLAPAPDGTLAQPSQWENSDAALTAMQVAFDLADGEDQEVIVAVALAVRAAAAEAGAAGAGAAAPAAAVGGGGAEAAAAAAAAGGMSDEQGSASASASASASSATSASSAPAAALRSLSARLVSILDGSVTAALHLDFLSSQAASDPVMLKRVKNAVDPKSSMLHTAVVAAHSYMQCGTTGDGFLRSNTEWQRKASNWAIFGMVASSGVIHKGNLSHARRILSSYLPEAPEQGHSASPYAEGGALLALGLIYANRGLAAEKGLYPNPKAVTDAAKAAAAAAREGKGGAAAMEEVEEEEEEEEEEEQQQPAAAAGAGAAAGAAAAAAPPPSNPVSSTIAYLLRSLEHTQAGVEALADQPIRNGACLALGLSAMGTGDPAIYRALRDVLMADVTVSSEAAGLALGLLLLGKGPEWRSLEFHENSATGVCDELLNTARDSSKEKIARSVALGLALMVLGLEEGAEALIGEMGGDKDSVVRYGAQYALGLAYAGTGNSGALRRLLHTAVSDVSDDVRRAAVTALGFILARTPRAVPGVVGQLAESYNPHVRYGAALAIGIACAGSGQPEALGVLEGLLEDSVDFVKSGALIAIGLVLQCENAAHFPRVGDIRERLNKIITGKLDGALTKMGAVLALGLMGAGGQNSTAGIL